MRNLCITTLWVLIALPALCQEIKQVDTTQSRTDNTTNTISEISVKDSSISQVKYPLVEVVNGKYSIDGKNADHQTFLAKTKGFNDEKLSNLILGAEKQGKTGKVLNIIGNIFLVTSAALITISIASSNQDFRLPGIIAAIPGAGLVLSGTIINIFAFKKRKKAVEHYNSLLVDNKS